MGEKRKRESYGPGQKIANKKLNAYVHMVSNQKHPACFQGIEAYKNAEEQHMKVNTRSWTYVTYTVLLWGFDTCI